jgi:hypothetical protein
MGNRSRYLRCKEAKLLPSEITPRRTMGTHPPSTRALLVHHPMKASLQTLVQALIYG